MSLFAELDQKALALGIPLSVHLDITWRCNEDCVHCYLDHDGIGEMNTAEIKGVIRQLADAGVFFLTISGGEPLMRRDCFELLEYARSLRFNVKLKTNAVLIGEAAAARLRELGIEQIQVSVYSDRAEVHDAITKRPGSLERTLTAIRFLKTQGLKVSITNVLMQPNFADGLAVQRLAKELGVEFHIDPTVTPKINGDRSIVKLNVGSTTLADVFRTEEYVGNVGEYCAPASAVDEDVLDGRPCSAGNTSCYVSPSGDVYPCVQFPILCGNLREQNFREIWQHSPALEKVRAIRVRDLHTCSGCNHVSYCSRCPGLAYMEGDMLGPSSADCAKSQARVGLTVLQPKGCGCGEPSHDSASSCCQA